MRTTDLAMQARKSVAAARIGLLTTYARHPAGQTTTTVSVRPRGDGSVDIQLGRDAVGTQQLLARPIATLELTPVGHDPVLLRGAVHRLPGVGASGTLLFHLDVAAVRSGAPAVLLDEHEYARATPDPLAAEAPAVLKHLNDAHADALAACLRTHGHPVGYAHATALDGSGLTVAVVTTSSVNTVRLRFPRPVTALSQLPTGLSLVLKSRCGCSVRGTAPAPSDQSRREP